MEKNIEVEIRALLDEKTRLTLNTFLTQKAKMKSEKERVFIDYSTFLEGIGERKMDIRTRVTNGKVELIVKAGSFGGGARTENSIFVEGNDLRGALSFMASLGYKKGVLGVRKIQAYQFGEIEIALQEVVSCDGANINERIWGAFAEFEIMTTESKKAQAIEELNAFLLSLGLEAFLDEAWFAYVKKMNNEANGVFDYDKDLDLLCGQIKSV